MIIPALSMAEQDRHKGALEPVRRDFLFLSIKEMVVEFSEKTVADDGRPAAQQVAQPASRRESSSCPRVTRRMRSPRRCWPNYSAQAGYAAIPFPVDFARDERLGIVAPHENDLFCISAVPPFAFAGAITLVRQLKLRFPRTKVIVGVWGFSGNTERALQRFQQSQPDCLVTSLAAAVQYVAEAQVDAPACSPTLIEA